MLSQKPTNNFEANLQAARKFMERGLVDERAFARAVTNYLVLVDVHDLEWCLDLVSRQELGLINRHLDEDVRSCDFQPSPSAFLTNLSDDAQMKQKVEELRPIYQRLCDLIAEKLG